MASPIFGNGTYPRPQFTNRIVDPATGQPWAPDRGGTATSRFAQAFMGPESGMAVPHVLTFTSLFGAAWRTYLHGQHDEALRFSREDALAMRNDAFVRSLVDERKRSVATLKWELEIDDPEDKWQVALRDGVTEILKATPRKKDLSWSGLEAMWYGRAGDQFDWYFKDVNLPAMPSTAAGGGLPTISVAPSKGVRTRRRALCMRAHMPIEGDKIGYDYDGNPYILVTSWAANRLMEQGADIRQHTKNGEWQRIAEPDPKATRPFFPEIKAKSADIGYTTIGGRALFLTGSWRSRFRIHTHETLDVSFFQPWKADAVHGVGIRSVIFWYWWLRQEFLANVTDWCARTGLGVRLWYYEQGNPASEAAIDQAAKDQNDKVNIKVPYDPTQPNRPAVEFVDTTGSGADLLLKIVKHTEDYLERYVVGQNMSSGSDEFSQGFGDRGRADFAKACVPLDSEILTRDGFKSCHDVQVDDEVLAYDCKTDSCIWTPLLKKTFFNNADVSKLSVRSASGSNSFEVICTPTHSWATESPLWKSDFARPNRTQPESFSVGARAAMVAKDTRRKLVKANELKSRHRIILAAVEHGSDESLLTPVEAALLGWAVTDGHIRRGRTGNFIVFIYQSKECFIPEIRALAGGFDAYEFQGEPTVRTFPSTGRTYACKPEHHWRLPEAIGTALLEKCGYCGKGSLPGIVTRLSPEARQAMLDAMLKAEATIHPRQTIFCNKNPHIMEAFEILCALEGCPTGRTRPVQHGCSVKTMKKTRYVTGQKLRMESVGSEDVWCPTTAFGTWVMRQRGQVTITGNTNWQITKLDAEGFDDTETRERVEVIKRWSYPELAEIPLRMKRAVDDPDIKKWVEGAKMILEMGGRIKESELYGRLGVSAPTATDKTVGGPEALQAMQATSGHVKPPDGLSPGGDKKPDEGAPEPKTRFESVTVHNHLPDQTAKLLFDPRPDLRAEPPQRFAVQGPIPPGIWDEIEREAKMHGPRAVDFIRAVMEAMQHTESPWEAIQLGRQAFLGGQALHYQREQARAAVEAAIPEMETREAARKAVVAAAEQAREQEAQSQRSDQEAERVRYEQAELAWRDHTEREEAQRYEQERDREAQLLKALEKLKPDSIDYDRFAKALKDSPIVVHVEVPRPDALDLTPIAEALKAMPAPEVTVNVPEPKPRTVKIKKNKDGDYTAETK